MTDDEIRSTGRTSSTAYTHGTSTTTNEEAGPEQRLFALAERSSMPLKRFDGDTLRTLAERLSLAIEHRIALALLDLEEIATLDLEEEHQP